MPFVANGLRMAAYPSEEHQKELRQPPRVSIHATHPAAIY